MVLWLLCAAGAILLICLCIVIHDVLFPVIREYAVASPKLKRGGVFVLLSDLHGCSFGRENKRLIRMILDAKPDAVLCTGDFLTALGRRTRITPGLQLLKGIRAAGVPVYFALGNHEQKLFRIKEQEGVDVITPFMRQAEEMGVIFIRNSSLRLPALSLTLYGLELPFSLFHTRVHRGKRSLSLLPVSALNSLIGTPDPDSFNLLLAHDPDFFPSYDAWGAELTVSGHVHGGVVRIPGIGGLIAPSLEIFPKYDGGFFQGEKGAMVISRGIGFHTLPVRFFNPGEVVVIRLRNWK